MVRILASRGLTDPVNVPGDDRGLAYGDGLFETILVRRGRPELVRAHGRRMLEGAARLRIPLEQTDLDQALSQGQALVRQAEGQDRLVLKLLLTRGSGGRGYRPPDYPEPRLLVSVHTAPPLPSGDGVGASISAVPLTVNPLLAGLKSLNRLEQVLASESIPDTCYEALMKGDRGDLREGTRTALIYRWQGGWWTPPRNQVAVNSVMVGHIESWLARKGEVLKEGYLTPEQCHQQDFGGLLLLNSVIGAVPVRSLEGRRLPMGERLATIVDLARNVEEFR
ncbi:aminotransferase class IV [Marinobacter zhanjiangensis]|uniref:Aminodeoxychorismate lyase n=1 Tax=Marinobacter zhanjiangensis TaxID=578215 RepID=A0ABQ3ARZ8_9GAMM|nr:aminotransferase class IV [Marinobacter zhanjiangensis]GGY64389.1 aminodeoxychorismate lyase [Marinobacter zhanjiangensis]